MGKKKTANIIKIANIVCSVALASLSIPLGIYILYSAFGCLDFSTTNSATHSILALSYVSVQCIGGGVFICFPFVFYRVFNLISESSLTGIEIIVSKLDTADKCKNGNEKQKSRKTPKRNTNTRKNMT